VALFAKEIKTMDPKDRIGYQVTKDSQHS
jgi:hypothetical protein